MAGQRSISYDLSVWETDKAPSLLFFFFCPKISMSAADVMRHDWLMAPNEFLQNVLSYLVNINFTFREENVEMPSTSCREQRGIHSTWRWERVVPRSLGRQMIPQLTWGGQLHNSMNRGRGYPAPRPAKLHALFTPLPPTCSPSTSFSASSGVADSLEPPETPWMQRGPSAQSRKCYQKPWMSGCLCWATLWVELSIFQLSLV